MAPDTTKIGGIMTSKEYFFYEWLILEKKMDSDTFSKLTRAELHTLKKEYAAYEKTLVPPLS